MFATIETHGATHIAIHIPHEGADRALPALARMLEENAVFIQRGYQQMGLVKPTMGITLGEKFEMEGNDEHLVIATGKPVISDEFVNATPEVFTSNAKAMKRERDENSRLRTELSFVKDELARARQQIEALTKAGEEDAE